MKQTGKFHVYEIKDDKRVVSAIANATLYFLDVNNQEQFKLTTKTDNEGNFNFDLAVGEYVVLATAGDGLEQVLANGSTFKLTAQSKVNAFEEWLNNPSENADSSLLAKFRELMQRTETAAEKGAKAAQEVELTLTTKTAESIKEIDTTTKSSISSIDTKKNESVKEINDTRDVAKSEISESVQAANTANTTLKNTTKDSINTIDKTKEDAEAGIKATKEDAIQEVEDSQADLKSEIDGKWDIQQTTGAGNVVRMSEVNKKIDVSIAGLAGNAALPNSPNFLQGRPQEGNGFYRWGSDSNAGYGNGFSLSHANNLINLSIALTSAEVFVRSHAIVGGKTHAYHYSLASQEWVNAKISDMSMKKDISSISDLEVEAMSKIPFQTFRYREEQSYTNDNAIFFGVIAQKVIRAFKDVGLDATDYNLVVNLQAKEKLSGDELGHIVGVSYIDLLVLEAEVTRRRLQRLEDFMYSQISLAMG